MQIGEVAARVGLSLRTIRHWGELGLAAPSGRSPGGFRLYTEEDVERILLIRRMKPLGFSLEEMCEAMSDIDALHTTTAEPGCSTSSAGPSRRPIGQLWKSRNAKSSVARISSVRLSSGISPSREAVSFIWCR